MKRTFLTTILALTAATTFAQSPSWLRLSQPSNYANYDVEEVAVGVDTLGNTYTAASVFDSTSNKYKAMLVKYNATGTQQWLKNQVDAYAFAESDVTQLLVDAVGNSYVIGYGIHDGITDYDFMVIKYDNAGNQSWIQYWDGGGSDKDVPTCAAFDASGNILIGGYVNTTNVSDFGVVKFSTTGSKLWSYTWNNSGTNDEDRVLGIASDAANNTFITGETYQTGTHRDMITMKLNSSGANQWTKIYSFTGDHGDDFGQSVVTDAAGNAYVTGGADYFITVKYDASGNQTWVNKYTTYETDNGNHKKVMMDKFGKLVVVGDAYVSGHSNDIIVNKIDPATGISIWSNNYDMNSGTSTSADRLEGAALDGAGNIYFTEYFEGAAGNDIGTAILSTSGTEVWHASYTNSGYSAGTDRPYCMAVDKDHNVMIAGVSQVAYNTQGDVAVLTMKYNSISAPTGVKQLTAGNGNVIVYPNPSTGIVHITVTDKSLIGAILTITNVTGELIMSRQITEQSQQIDLSNVAKGLYLMNIRNAAIALTQKLTIK